MPSHVLFVSTPAVGHFRPLVGLACRLAIKWQSQRPESDSLIITIPVCGGYKRLVEEEMDRYLTSTTNKVLRENIHVISLGGEGKDLMQLLPILLQNFESFYASLRSLEPIKCATGPIHTFTRAPDVAVTGFFMTDCLYSIRKISQREVPVLCFITAALSVMRVVGPEALGGLGDIEAKAKVLAEAAGISLEEAEYKVYHAQAGEVIKVPGMPLMYDHEYYPQMSHIIRIEVQIPAYKRSFKMLHECDGIVLSNSIAFDPEGYETVKAWAAETNRPVYAVGPLLPDEVLHAPGTTRRDGPDESISGQEVITFLDKVYASCGAHSLLYVSFGTLFWPPGDKIWLVIEYILDSKIPLLLSYDEPRLGKIPDHIAEKFRTSDRALTSFWTPQQAVLGHKCTGWFMTHCGHNSILEAIVQGVPMMAWPIGGEQPGNAAHMSLTLNIAYEIVEGRTELGLKPMYRGVQPKGTLEALKEEIRMILENAFGEDGKLKRKNILALGDKMRAGLREGGDSSNEIERFIRDYLSV